MIICIAMLVINGRRSDVECASGRKRIVNYSIPFLSVCYLNNECCASKFRQYGQQFGLLP